MQEDVQVLPLNLGKSVVFSGCDLWEKLGKLQGKSFNDARHSQ